MFSIQHGPSSSQELPKEERTVQSLQDSDAHRVRQNGHMSITGGMPIRQLHTDLVRKRLSGPKKDLQTPSDYFIEGSGSSSNQRRCSKCCKPALSGS